MPVVGFTGSKIWQDLAMFPPVPAGVIALTTVRPGREMSQGRPTLPCPANFSIDMTMCRYLWSKNGVCQPESVTRETA